MRVLLDTHAALWIVSGDPQLSARAVEALGAPDVTVMLSAAVVWEIAIKRGLQKLDVPDDYLHALTEAGAVPLPIGFAHAERVGRLPPHHRDPFDRLLVAQALVEGATIVTADPQIAAYDVPVLW